MPAVDLRIQVEEPLFDEEQCAAGNKLTLGGEGYMYSLPESWRVKEGKEMPDADLFDYELLVHLPLAKNGDMTKVHHATAQPQPYQTLLTPAPP